MFDTIVTMHYGTEYKKTNRINSHPSIHCPTSKGVSEVSERGSKWTSEWPSTPVCILGCSGPLCDGDDDANDDVDDDDAPRISVRDHRLKETVSLRNHADSDLRLGSTDEPALHTRQSKCFQMKGINHP